MRHHCAAKIIAFPKTCCFAEPVFDVASVLDVSPRLFQAVFGASACCPAAITRAKLSCSGRNDQRALTRQTSNAALGIDMCVAGPHVTSHPCRAPPRQAPTVETHLRQLPPRRLLYVAGSEKRPHFDLTAAVKNALAGFTLENLQEKLIQDSIGRSAGNGSSKFAGVVRMTGTKDRFHAVLYKTEAGRSVQILCRLYDDEPIAAMARDIAALLCRGGCAAALFIVCCCTVAIGRANVGPQVRRISSEFTVTQQSVSDGRGTPTNYAYSDAQLDEIQPGRGVPGSPSCSTQTQRWQPQ